MNIEAVQEVPQSQLPSTSNSERKNGRTETSIAKKDTSTTSQATSSLYPMSGDHKNGLDRKKE